MEQATIVALIIALTELAKRLGFPPKFAPFISMAIGVGFAMLTIVSVDSAIQGIIMGLMASGLWDVGKTTLKGIS